MKYKASIAAGLVFAMYIFSLFFGSQSVREAIALCAKSLVPGLFCSVVFSLYLVKSGIWTYFGQGALFMTGLLCGFPTGAIMASSLYKSGQISENQARRLCFLYSLPSPAFVISVVGGEMYGSLLLGAMLYTVLLMSLLVCDMIFYAGEENTPPEKKCRGLLISLVDSLSESGQKCLTICSFVMFFYVIGSAVSNIGFANKYIAALVLSLLEMTGAVSAISALSPNTAFVMTAFALAFSGLSVGAQVGFYATHGGISMRGYFVKRTVLGAVAVLLSLALVYLSSACFAIVCATVLFCFFFVRKYLQKGGKNKKDAENAAYEGFVYKAADKAKSKA